MSHWQLWALAAVLLLVAEMVAQGFWLACVALGAGVAAVAALLPFGLPGELAAFAAGTFLAFVGVRPFLMRHFRLSGGRGIRTNVDALVGKSGVVAERIEPGTGRGRVVVEGENWRGASLTDVALEPGTKIMVVQVDGTTLVVEKDGME